MDQSDANGMRVVVIDDDAMVLRSIDSALTDIGFKVSTFSDARKATEAIAATGCDIVVSDICMPGFDGFQVLKRVKEIDESCDVIFVTAHGQMDTAIRALREGATDFFEKPFNASALAAAMERTRRYRLLAQQKRILTEQVDILCSEIAPAADPNVIISRSLAMQKIAAGIVDVSASNVTVLILGESGTGKELIAHAIHRASKRASKPFLTLNCPSVPEDLFESEMFGHRKGAYTGAIETRSGYVEAAEGGTLFMDEIGDLPLKSQSKILRFLEQKTYIPVGESRERPADVRIVAATNQPLETLVKEKKFREDLFYRLGVCTLRLPPLRERREDIPLLSLYFALRFAGEMNRILDGIDDDALQVLSLYDYPGNIRELRNIIESSIIHCRHSGMLRKEDLPPLQSSLNASAPAAAQSFPIPVTGSLRFEDVERNLYMEALSRTQQNVSAAARVLGLSRGKLRRRMAALKIEEV